MSYSVFLHPDVEKYLDSLGDSEKKRCYKSLKRSSKDSYELCSGCDRRKMSDRKTFYRLRVGDHRFLYVIKDDEILVEEAFKEKKVIERGSLVNLCDSRLEN